MNTVRSYRSLRLVTLLLVCLLVPACSKANPKLTKANFDQIKPNMTLLEVESYLGKGEPEEGGTSLPEGSSAAGAAGIAGDLSSVQRSASGTKWYKWGDDKKHIRIGFVNDRVAQGKIQQQGL